MLNQLEKALNLAKKTGDRLIVFDQLKTDHALVILGLDDYEKLALKGEDKSDLTEDDLLDTINRNIAAWKNDSDAVNSDMTAADFFSAKNEQKYSEKPLEEDEEKRSKNAKNLWSIPKQIKEGAEEIIEEDRQYLEEVPF
jgi:hypothetical protein